MPDHIRTIKPEFFTSGDIVALSPMARLFFIATWLAADREGRLHWNLRNFRLRYFPGDTCDMEGLAAELLKAGLIVLYGEGLAYIPTFNHHQFINNRERASVLPSPDGQPDDSPPPETESDGKALEASKKSKSTIGKGRESASEARVDASATRHDASATRAHSFTPPESIRPDTWEKVLAYRKSNRQPLIEESLSLLVDKLERYCAPGHDPNVMLEEMMERGWSTVFPPKNYGGQQNGVALQVAAPLTVELPAWMPREAWERYVVFCSEKGRPVTNTTGPALIDMLAKIRKAGWYVTDVLTQCIANNWLDVRMPRDGDPNIGRDDPALADLMHGAI